MPSAAAVTLQLTAFRAGTGAALRELPGRLLVAKWGDTETGRGVVRVNDVTAARLPAMQQLRKFDRVALDFQHNTLSGQEPVKVAGFGVPRVVPGEGIWLEGIEWTPEGRELLPAGHYPDISPAVERLPDGTIIFLHSAAAVRQGDLDGLTLFSASLTPAPAMPTDALAALRALLKLLGIDLAEDASAEAIAAAAAKATDAVAALKPDKTADGAPEAFAAAVTTAMAPLVTRLNSIETAARTGEVQALLNAATAAGKIVPFSAETALKLTPDELKATLEKLPGGQVPVDGAARHDVTAFSANATGSMHPDELAALKSLGYSEADLKPKA